MHTHVHAHIGGVPLGSLEEEEGYQRRSGGVMNTDATRCHSYTKTHSLTQTGKHGNEAWEEEPDGGERDGTAERMTGRGEDEGAERREATISWKRSNMNYEGRDQRRKLRGKKWRTRCETEKRKKLTLSPPNHQMCRLCQEAEMLCFSVMIATKPTIPDAFVTKCWLGYKNLNSSPDRLEISWSAFTQWELG